MSPAPPATLRSARLRVRRLVPGDVAGFHAIWGDPEVIFWGACASVEASARRLHELIARCQGHPWPVGWHAVEHATDGDLVGDVVLQPAPFAPGEWEVGWHVRRDAWGRGFATEAAAALLAEAFRLLAPPHLVAAVLPTNVRSRAVASRLGMCAAGTVMHAGHVHELWVATAPAIRATNP